MPQRNTQQTPEIDCITLKEFGKNRIETSPYACLHFWLGRLVLGCGVVEGFGDRDLSML